MIVGVLVLVLLTSGITYMFVSGMQKDKNIQPPPTISVMGEATKKVMPDQFMLSFTVSGNGSNAATSTQEAAKNLAKVKNALMPMPGAWAIG